ncbi:hypothetical protein AGLY_009989 [Aphis glycines]|uniref:Uncharacterized protein n=1 Tax=Aphis glycines TaxID=307491 RepID=A0A6G0TGZ9_APHGL|nr:hypothetical protein AGLY_009989 [Aphis glycines]
MARSNYIKLQWSNICLYFKFRYLWAITTTLRYRYKLQIGTAGLAGTDIFNLVVYPVKPASSYCLDKCLDYQYFNCGRLIQYGIINRCRGVGELGFPNKKLLMNLKFNKRQDHQTHIPKHYKPIMKSRNHLVSVGMDHLRLKQNFYTRVNIPIALHIFYVYYYIYQYREFYETLLLLRTYFDYGSTHLSDGRKQVFIIIGYILSA